MSFYFMECNCKPNNKKMTTSLQTRPYSQKTQNFQLQKYFKAVFLKEKPKDKRTSSTTRIQGSLTIECAMILPLFFMTVMTIVSFMIAMKTENDIQRILHRKAKVLSAFGYLQEKELDEEEIQNRFSIPASLYTYAYLKSDFLSELNQSRFRQSMIVMGSKGINLLRSVIQKDDWVDLIATYELQAPFYAVSFDNFRMISRCRIRAFNGYQIDVHKEEQRVYITENSKVYHTNVQCKYLDLSIQSCYKAEISILRNKNGERFLSCSKCKGWLSLMTVYYTDYGTFYHSSLDCSSLKRTVQIILLRDVGKRRACKGCENYE